LRTGAARAEPASRSVVIAAIADRMIIYRAP
jgi:hypothetical protein